MKNNMEILSPGEITFYVTRAAVSIGVPFGLAEDFAKSLLWAQLTGVDLAQLALDSLEALASTPGTARTAFHQTDINLVFFGESGLSGVFAGPSLSDFWKLLPAKGCNLIAKKVDFPILVAGAFVVAEARPVVLEWADKLITISANGEIELIAPDDKTLSARGPFNIFIRKPENQMNSMSNIFLNTNDLDQRSLRNTYEGISVNKNAWAGIVALFNRNLIPTSQQSQEIGAGAGLVDTD